MMHETNNDRSVLSPSIWAKQTIFFVLGFFLMVSPLYPQEKSGSGQEPAAMVSSKKKEAQKDMTALEKKSLAAVSQEVEEIQKETALPPVVQDEEALFASDIDSQKAMENVLQEVILKDMQTYYPSIRSITLESDDESSTLEITYDQSSSQDKLQIKTNLIKNEMRAEIIITTPLLQKKDELTVMGDDVFLEKINLIPDKRLSVNLGSDSKLTFVGRIEFSVLRPIRWKIRQTPGILRIEFRPYLAGDDDEEVIEEEEDILFHAPAMEEVSEVLGESYSLERKYENELVSGGEMTLLEDLRGNLPGVGAKLKKITDYSRGMSDEAIRYDLQDRYPTFGSLQYWKKHLSGIVSNTTQFLKRERNDHPFMVEQPGVAVVFRRKGTADIQLGYGLQRELPFFYGKLGGLAPMDGFVRHDINGGLVYKTQGPWTYSIQNNLRIGTSENLVSPAKFGDRLTSYNYELAQGLLYKFVHGYAKLSSGMRVQTEELGASEEIKAYWSAVLGRAVSKKIGLKAEYLHEHAFLQDPPPIANRDIHKMRFGLIYQPRSNIAFSPSFGTAFYKGEAFSNWIGGFAYSHTFNSRSRLAVDYSTDVSVRPVASFGAESLNATRPTVSLRNDFIRYQNVSISYQRELGARTSLILSGGYSRERQVETEISDKLDIYRISIAVNRKLMKDWELELKYLFNYIDAFQVATDSTGMMIKNDVGNTAHTVYLRMSHYFSKGE